MAMTLVVKGADFESNALDQVVIEVIECTGISLSESTVSIVTTGNTSTVTATVTPLDCTQPVVWSTSDSDVATVSNGVITAAGVGSAMITATCGSYSDTCVVTVTEFMNKAILMKMSGAYTNYNNAVSDSGNGLTTLMTSSTYAKYGILASTTGEKYASKIGGDSGTPFYPYPIPHNAKRVKVTDTGSSGIKKQTINWYNLDTSPELSGYDDFCAVLGGTAVSNDSSTTVTVDIPTYTNLPDVDGLLIMFRTYKTGTTFDDTDFDEVSIEFLPAAE